MRNIDVAEVLLDENILSYLISDTPSAMNFFLCCSATSVPVDESVVEAEIEDEVAQVLLDLPARILVVSVVGREHTQ